jgi:hypothetical protein
LVTKSFFESKEILINLVFINFIEEIFLVLRFFIDKQSSSLSLLERQHLSYNLCKFPIKSITKLKKNLKRKRLLLLHSESSVIIRNLNSFTNFKMS